MATKKTDWANIPDDDEEEDEYENEEEEELNEQETQQQETPETTATNENKQEKSQLSGSEDQKAGLIAFINNSTHPKIYLNLYNVSPNVTEAHIREFYSPLKIDYVLPFANKVMYDLEFSNKEDALKVVEKGVGVIQNESFKLRISNKSLNPRSTNYEKRDKFEKGSDRRYGHQDRKGGNYYDSKESRGGYGQKRNEGGYGERRNNYRENRKYQDEPKYVKKEEEAVKLPAEWEKVWAEREKNENSTEPQEDQNGKHGSDNRYKGGNTYHNEEFKDEQIVKKGRGQTKYENEDTLEQDKIIHKKNYNDSSNYRGGDGKGGYSNRNKGGYSSHENNYSSRDYKDKQGYNNDYKRDEHGKQYRGGYHGRNTDDKYRSNNQAGHKPASKEVVYVQKGSEKTGGESPQQRKSLNSGSQGTNKTNIFTLLE